MATWRNIEVGRRSISWKKWKSISTGRRRREASIGVCEKKMKSLKAAHRGGRQLLSAGGGGGNEHGRRWRGGIGRKQIMSAAITAKYRNILQQVESGRSKQSTGKIYQRNQYRSCCCRNQAGAWRKPERSILSSLTPLLTWSCGWLLWRPCWSSVASG